MTPFPRNFLMGFLRRLFSRSPNAASISSRPEANLSAEPSEGGVTVPPDHHVTVYRPSIEPKLQRSRGGALIADLGAASDEFREELRRIADEIECTASTNDPEVGARPPPILITTDSHQLSELFAPNDVKVTPLPGLLLWVVDAGSADLWLREPEPLLAAIRRTGAYRINEGLITQFVMLVIESRLVGTVGAEAPSFQTPPGISELARILSDAGATVVTVPHDGVFFVEVCRPEAVLGSLRMERYLLSLPENSLSKEEVCTPRRRPPPSVIRAPRLRRLTTAAMDEPSERTSSQFFGELLSREIALLVITDRAGRARTMSWPQGEGFPVYPDVSSILQAAEDLQIRRDSFAFAQFLPRDLFNWADQQPSGGVALNVYRDRNTPNYLFLTKDKVRTLARGGIPNRKRGD
jgi:hypothetical protein